MTDEHTELEAKVAELGGDCKYLPLWEQSEKRVKELEAELTCLIDFICELIESVKDGNP